MTDDAVAAAPPAPDDQADFPLDEAVPDVLTKLSRPGVVARLEKASKRGTLPGFNKSDPEGVCALSLFGDPFDKTLVMLADVEDDGRTRLHWKTRLSPKMPAVLLAVLAVTVWPGEPLTDSLLKTYFEFYRGWIAAGLQTWMWYLPLTVPAIPLTWHLAMKRTRRSTHQSAHKTVRKIAEAVGGELVPPRLRRSL